MAARIDQDVLLVAEQPTDSAARVKQDLALVATQPTATEVRVAQDLILVAIPRAIPPPPVTGGAVTGTSGWGRGFAGVATLTPDLSNTGVTITGTSTGGGTAGGSSTGTGGGGSAGDLGASPYDFSFFFNGKPDAAFEILRVPVTRQINLPAGLLGSQAVCETAATADATLNIKRISGGVTTTIGTIKFAAGAFVGTFTFDSAVTLLQGDILLIVAPSVQDSTLATIGGALAGTR